MKPAAVVYKHRRYDMFGNMEEATAVLRAGKKGRGKKLGECYFWPNGIAMAQMERILSEQAQQQGYEILWWGEGD